MNRTNVCLCNVVWWSMGMKIREWLIRLVCVCVKMNACRSVRLILICIVVLSHALSYFAKASFTFLTLYWWWKIRKNEQKIWKWIEFYTQRQFQYAIAIAIGCMRVLCVCVCAASYISLYFHRFIRNMLSYLTKIFSTWRCVCVHGW